MRLERLSMHFSSTTSGDMIDLGVHCFDAPFSKLITGIHQPFICLIDFVLVCLPSSLVHYSGPSINALLNLVLWPVLYFRGLMGIGWDASER